MSRHLRIWWTQPAGGRAVLRLALPLVVSQVSVMVTFFTDRMFLFSHAPDELAASMPAMGVWWLVVAFPLGICLYTNTFVSQYHGARQPRRIGPAVWQGVWFAVAAAPLVLATIPLAPRIFAWAGHGRDVIPLEIEYYQIICCGAGFLLAGEALACFFTGRGLTSTVMVVSAVAAGLNVLLDYLWIFGYGGFPEMGIAGAGWATVLSQAVKAAIFLALIWRRDARRDFGTWQGCRFDFALTRRMIHFGAPAGWQLALEVLGYNVFILYLGRLGKSQLTATNLAFNISMLAFVPVLGLGIAASTLVGQWLGENRDDLAARATWNTSFVALAYMAFVSTFYLFLPDVLLSLHAAMSPDEVDRFRDTAVVLFRFVAAYNLADALMIVFSGAIKGAGDTRFVMFTTLVMAAVLAVGAWLAVEQLELGLYGCWTLITAWLWIVGAIFLARFIQGRWRQMRVIEPPVAEVLADTVPRSVGEESVFSAR